MLDRDQIFDNKQQRIISNVHFLLEVQIRRKSKRIYMVWGYVKKFRRAILKNFLESEN